VTDWRKIPGLPERFEASSEGEIRSLPYETKVVSKHGTVRIRQMSGKTLTQRTWDGGKSKGHPVVSISCQTTSGTKVGEQRVSVMVARAFHGCPYEPGDAAESNKWRVLHRDGDITNTAADNIEWVTSNGGSPNSASYKLYESNIRKLEQQRQEPVINWAKRVFGDDFEFEEANAEDANQFQ
jgi:hypothetical protein